MEVYVLVDRREEPREVVLVADEIGKAKEAAQELEPVVLVWTARGDEHWGKRFGEIIFQISVREVI